MRPASSSRPAHSTRAFPADGKPPTPSTRVRNGSTALAASSTRCGTQSVSRGQVRPRNFSVTCQFSRGAQRAFGNSSRQGAKASSTASLPRRDLDRDEEPERFRFGTDARSRAIGSGDRGRERPALQVTTKEVQRGLLRPTADTIALARHLEAPRVRDVVAFQRDPDRAGRRAAVGSGPAAPVSASPRSAANTRRAPAAISRAHSSLTGPGPPTSPAKRRARLPSPRSV